LDEVSERDRRRKKIKNRDERIKTWGTFLPLHPVKAETDQE